MEAKKVNNTYLNVAKNAKDDEFYTQMSTIEKEMSFYKENFQGKTVYCNCDDARKSNFFKFFFENFHTLGLKKLIASCYKSSKLNSRTDTGVWVEYFGENKETFNLEVQYLKGDGDFRSPEALNLLKEADIVVTNPPFSLFQDFVKLMNEKGKQFLLLGSQNANSCKTVFNLIREGKLWLGRSVKSGAVEFEIPEHYNRSSSSYYKENGKKYVKVPGIRWFTNIQSEDKNPELALTKSYYKEKQLYSKFDNYNAINVNKTADIPSDYFGCMGVPITFLDKFNSEQFEIVGMTKSWDNSGLHNGAVKCKDGMVNGKRIYARILIRRKLKATNKSVA